MTGREGGGAAALGRLPWFMWSLGALFFCYGFFQRVAPSVMISDLMRDFGVTAGVLGNLSAFYFYAYAGMQLPVGVVVDNWGSRRVLAGGALICSIGTLLFATATTLGPAYLGRFLIGCGAGIALMATMKLAATWLPPGHFALMSGLTGMLGMVGAVGAQAPMAAMVAHFGWRDTLSATAAGGVAIAFVNTIIMASGAAFQPLVGWLLDVNWDGRMEAGARVYTEETFQVALLPLVASNVLGILMVFFVRETHGRNLHRDG